MPVFKDLERGDTKKHFTFGNTEDAERVKRAIIEAGENSFGIVAIDLWLFDNQNAMLFHYGESGITWVNPLFDDQLKFSKTDDETYDNFQRLTNIDRADHFIPTPQAPGVGIAGNCWMTEKYGKMVHPDVTQISMKSMRGSMMVRRINEPKSLVWREISEFTSDPDKMPHDPERMLSLEKVFGKVIGIPFDIVGYRGVVLYFARKSASNDALNVTSNVKFLHFATQNIGISSAMTTVRCEIAKERQNISQSAYKRLSTAMLCASTFKKTIGTEKIPLKTSSSRKCEALWNASHTAYRKFVSTTRKSLNPPDMEPPAGAPLGACMLSLFGSFLTLLILGSLNDFIVDDTDGEYSIVLGPIGALLTLQYALTAAPASQPRNSLFGIILSVSVSIIVTEAFNYFDIFAKWVVIAVATSFSIFLMQITGFVHPPAGAAALVFSSRSRGFDRSFVNLGLFLVADVLSIIIAMVINNMSDKKQYPIYWRLNIVKMKGKSK